MTEPIAETKTYRLSRAGRRMAYLLLAGAVLIWLFALWTLKNTLKLSLRSPGLGPSLRTLGHRLVGAEGAQPLAAEEAIPAVVMLVLLIVVPLLVWNILEELRASFIVGPAGLTFRSLGIELAYPWEEVADLHPVDEEAEERLDELVLRTSRLSKIRNPLARFLHWQAYGRRRLPLYGGLEEREDLIARIRTHLAPAEATPQDAGSLPAPEGEVAGGETTAADTLRGEG